MLLSSIGRTERSQRSKRGSIPRRGTQGPVVQWQNKSPSNSRDRIVTGWGHVKFYLVIAATLACLLSGAALTVSLSHKGPSGPQGLRGLQGVSGRNGQDATQNRYGVCWEDTTQTSTDGSVSWVNSVNITSAQLVSGVYQCPMGENFVSIVPAPVNNG